MSITTGEKINTRTMENSIKNRIITISLAAILAAGGFAVPVSVNCSYGIGKTKPSGEFADGRVIVCYADSEDVDMTAGQERKAGILLGEAETLMKVEHTDVDNVNISEEKLSAEVIDEGTVEETIAVVNSESESTEELIKNIEKLPNVDFAEPDYILQLDTCEAEAEEKDVNSLIGTAEIADGNGNSVLYDEQIITENYPQWAFDSGEPFGVAVENWDRKGVENASETVVAVVDSGIDYNHYDLKNTMWKKSEEAAAKPECAKNLDGFGFGEYGIDVRNGDNNPMDDYFHGTHCAGIIAAEWGNGGVAGIASGTKLMAVKVANENGNLTMSDVVKGYSKIIEAKRAGVNIVAINNSWGGKISSADNLNRAVTEAGETGIVSVFSSANSGTNCDNYSRLQDVPYYIKDNPYKITVNSIDKDGKKSSFSNYGLCTTDIAAPGRNIYSTMPGNAYEQKNGTSMAAPVVTGEAAIVEAEFGVENYGADIIAAIVKENAKAIDSMNGKCSSGGMADVGKAVSADPKNIGYKKFCLEYDTCVFDEENKEPAVIAAGLKEGRDYSVSYRNNRNAGTATAIINVNNGIYHAELDRTFEITKAAPEVSVNPSGFICTGKKQSVTVTVKDAKGRKLAEGTDYDIAGLTWGTVPGTYPVQVRMKGSKSSNYNNGQAAFKIEVKKTKFKEINRGKKSFTVRVAKQPKKYVNGYQVRYSRYSSMAKAKVKIIGKKYNKVSRKVSGLKKSSWYYVQVRAYKTIGKTRYYSGWSGVKMVKTR